MANTTGVQKINNLSIVKLLGVSLFSNGIGVLFVIPYITFFLLLTGIAALPYWQQILVVGPWLLILGFTSNINMYLTRGFPTHTRVFGLLANSLVLICVGAAFSGYIKNFFADMGQF